MKHLFKIADTFLVVFVVAIAAMLIVPLPTPLLDVLLVVNISFSILLLLVGLYVSNSSMLYTFPTVLLLSTLFRLGLNVASARLILSQADAGRVIESFGTFLIGGEIVVGVIVFCIITIVNFIVISKGAARVSEVAARFFLDAMPGKQVAIDNDTRAGLISADEARVKRDSLNREGQLYGSMDGAMNFVQGDAIAGFFIIVANIFGGIYLGLANGMGVQDAIQTYTILTVGDGLVTQIPSLLTSICAGIVVTRVASSDAATLSGDLKSQFFSQPVVLLVTAGILLLFALLPGIPASPFLLVGSCLIISASLMFRRRRVGVSGVGMTPEFQRQSGLPAPSSLTAEIDYDETGVVVHLDASVLHRVFKSNPAKFISTWRLLQNEFHADIGVMLPEVSVKAGDLLTPASFLVEVSGVEAIAGSVIPDALLVELGVSQAMAIGLDVLAEEDHPISGHRVLWTANTAEHRRVLEAAAIRSYDAFEYLCLRVAHFATRHPEEFLSVTDVHTLLRQIEKKHPGLVADGIGKDFVAIPRLSEIMQELVREGVSIRDFRGIIEAVSSFCSVNSANGASSGDNSNFQFEMGELVAYIRAARRRPLIRRFMGAGRSLQVVVLSDTVEEAFDGVELMDGSQGALTLDGDLRQGLTVGLNNVLRPALDFGVSQLGLLCRSEMRPKLLAFVRSIGRSIFVVTFEELDESVLVEQIGTWSLASR